MSNDISKVVDRIREDMCKDCDQRCGLCDHGICQEVVLEVGCYFVQCAQKEHEEQREQ